MVSQCKYCSREFASKEARMQHERSSAHMKRCNDCGASFLSQTEYDLHVLEHRFVERNSPIAIRCNLCNVLSNSEVDYSNHAKGRRHQTALKSASIAQYAPERIDVPVNCQACNICNTFVPTKVWAQHAAGARHQQKLNEAQLEQALDTSEAVKHGVTLDADEIDFGVVPAGQTVTCANKTGKITNNGFPIVYLTHMRLSSQSGRSSFSVEDANRTRQVNRTSSLLIRINLNASSDIRGQLRDRLEMTFETAQPRKRFTITRPIVARIGSREDYDAMPASTPYARRNRKKSQFNPYAKVVPGVKPVLLADIKWEKRLPFYELPIPLGRLISDEETKSYEKIHAIRRAFMRGAFGPSTYHYHYQTMLWIEELRAQDELSEFDIDETTLVQRGSAFVLQVPGLAEKRPSVLHGDHMWVRPSGSDETAFEGIVHNIDETSVYLHFNKKFKFVPGRKYEIQFRLNRLVFRRMHQGISCVEFAGRVAFPDPRLALKPVPDSRMKAIVPVNANIWNNDAQRRAVASITNMPPGSNPFIVYGPPGTGKTVTVVEAIHQILKSRPDARILACAPSNSAADTLTERLVDLGRERLIRLVAPSRKRKTVSAKVLPFTRSNKDEIFICPPKDELKRFKVVVSTCCSASVPYGIGIEPGHFTHVFVDEAGQATEPEVMVPIRTSLGPKTNVIISGDVKQLGPIVRSALARELGLGKSYLERLMDTDMYNEVSGRNKSLVKLVQNYRSHASILAFPNAKFYRNELERCAQPDKTHRIVNRWKGLVRKDFPIMFHSVQGKDARDKSSPSYYNADEVVVVKEHIQSLLNDKTLKLEPKDIGVITPYRAQVHRIKSRIGTFAKGTVVGSVEEFQGQERPVIIMSTVRSSQETLTYDLRHTLGFVANPRRFNVAVTRAQALLVVVGDPFVLSLDPLWKQFINFVYVNGGFKGVDIDWDPNECVEDHADLVGARRNQGMTELEELIQRTSEMDLAAEEEAEWEVIREED